LTGWLDYELGRPAGNLGECEASLLVAGYPQRLRRGLHLDIALLWRCQPAIDACRPVGVRVDPDHNGQAVAVEGNQATLLGSADRQIQPVILRREPGYLDIEVAERECEPDPPRKVGRHGVRGLEQVANTV
jgi:hypothetical protein